MLYCTNNKSLRCVADKMEPITGDKRDRVFFCVIKDIDFMRFDGHQLLYAICMLAVNRLDGYFISKPYGYFAA